MELNVTTQVILLGGVVASIMGFVAAKTNFCTMGAVSDWINMGDTNRLRTWFLAMVVGIVGVMVLEGLGLFSLDSTRPPYRSSMFPLVDYVLGGLMFGVGMTLASGCGNKTLLRIGGGNLKSIIVFLIAGTMAYFMTHTLSAETDKTLYSILFFPWTRHFTLDLPANQDLGSLLAAITGADAGMLRLVMGGLLATIISFVIFRSADFRRSGEILLSGLVIGICVLFAWYITGSLLFGEEGTWLEATEWLEGDERPVGIGVQSFTFINPMGETLAYMANPGNSLLITFGVGALVGVLLGSFAYALVSRSFRIEWFYDLRDFINHAIGAVLMGVGGVLAVGCTIGQGISGVSTLSLGSMLALASIILGSALTMKVQYYKLVYEDEATFPAALLSGMVDLKLLPEKLRKLEAI
ncbi:MAG: membrane protein [Gammaproteobacteria bacterium (ex Lamellibrachia satsuma)]|nr:MAG: YeeE/YedE family protein [Gammaproteobacteria bacterium (ex Lamellibrachia satsuma)]RRS34769.1 MAG: membrane protein [Gammaproteobacteria bacterium (ex Lamellibrachia satsuma)]RRS34850.1 MAG: membrane protein [Gammaproteobacteria bacterium (ex Lamellibrachia satsuma)]